MTNPPPAQGRCFAILGHDTQCPNAGDRYEAGDRGFAFMYICDEHARHAPPGFRKIDPGSPQPPTAAPQKN